MNDETEQGPSEPVPLTEPPPPVPDLPEWTEVPEYGPQNIREGWGDDVETRDVTDLLGGEG